MIIYLRWLIFFHYEFVSSFSLVTITKPTTYLLQGVDRIPDGHITRHFLQELHQFTV